MREMLPNLEKGFPTAYRCSECGWSFPLSRLSDLGDYFQQKTATRAFSEHDCNAAPAAARPWTQRTNDSHPKADTPPNPLTC